MLRRQRLARSRMGGAADVPIGDESLARWRNDEAHSRFRAGSLALGAAGGREAFAFTPGASTPDSPARRAARVRKWPTWTGRPRCSAADRPAPLPRGAYLDETAGPDLLLAVQGYERDIQMMRSRDVHSVGATEPDLGG